MKRLDRAISRLFGARRESDFTLIVRWAYAYYLKREPDEAGLEGYVAQLRKGMTVGQLAAALADSDEARELAESAPWSPFLAMTLREEAVDALLLGESERAGELDMIFAAILHRAPGFVHHGDDAIDVGEIGEKL